MASFDELLSGIHDSVMDTPTTQSNIIAIDNKRQFTPVDFDTVIAYEGDINSQIITFQLPKMHEGHELSGCTDKILKWKNLASGVEGTFKLKPTTVDEDNDHLYLQWEVAPEAFSEAGNIEISMSFFDYTDKEKTSLAFSWNTPPYSGLSVGKSNADVGYHFPAKNEILIIDKETKQIIAPAGYNNIICNFGDVGVANVYFLVNRYLGKNEDLDILASEITIYVIINGYRREVILPKEACRTYSAEIDGRKNGLIFIEWEVSEEFTAQEMFGPGGLQVALGFAIKEGEVVKKRWLSNLYSNLKIDSSIIEIIPEPGAPAVTRDSIYKLVEDFFTTNEIIIE